MTNISSVIVAEPSNRLKAPGARDFLVSLTPKTLNKLMAMERKMVSTTPITTASHTLNHHEKHRDNHPVNPQIATPVPSRPSQTDLQNDQQQQQQVYQPPQAQPVHRTSTRSNSTSSGQSNISLDSDGSASTTGSKRSSWTRAFFGGQRSKSQNSLNNFEQHFADVEEKPAVPGCLKNHEARLRRILECTQKNVNGLIVRTQHTEADVTQMVAHHCNHVGCRRKAINAAMRNLERRISMLNKYRDAIFHFVVNKHQEVLASPPAKKAEAEALYDMCVKNSRICMELANQGAQTSGTTLVALSERLHKMQRQLNESSQHQELQAGNSQQNQLQGNGNVVNNYGTGSNLPSPTRSMSTFSLHSHGEGETEDYVMAVVPTVPQPIQFKLKKPAKPAHCKSGSLSTTLSGGLGSGSFDRERPGSPTTAAGTSGGATSSSMATSSARVLCARSSRLQKLDSQDQIM